jgi:hypothetical protein
MGGPNVGRIWPEFGPNLRRTMPNVARRRAIERQLALSGCMTMEV